MNSFLSTTFLNRIDLGAAGPFQFATVAEGNDTLREEGLSAYEAGYIGGFGRLTLGGAVYLNRTDNMIQFTQSDSYTSSHAPPGWPLPLLVLDQLLAGGRGLPSRFTYLNFEHVVDRGLELSSDFRVNAAASTFVNYSWQAAPEPTGFDVSELNLPPAHRVNAGLSVKRGRYFGNLSASLVDGAYWQDVLPGYEGRTEPYTLVDGGFGVRSSDGTMTVGIRTTNLLNTPIQQHVFGDVIRRTVTGEARFQF